MFDLKYRPKDFDSVIGNHAVVSFLRQRSIKKALNLRCLMFGGPRGSGKTTLARIVARASVCVHTENGNPCNRCESCLDSLKDSSLKITEIDAASSGTVDRIRSIVDELDFADFDNHKTVLILDEAHRLGPASQDALLKSMEDRRVFAILCTTEPHKIRPAMRDRVDEFVIKPPTSTEMLESTRRICELEGVKYDDDALKVVINNCERLPRSVYNAVYMLGSVGDITISRVNEFYRYDSVVNLNTLVSKLSDGRHDWTLWENLTLRESGSWIRDKVCDIVSDGLRIFYGVNPRNSYSIGFINSENIGFYKDLALKLSIIEKPTIVGLEFLLFSPKMISIPVEHPTPNRAPQYSVSIPVVTKSVTPKQEVLSPKPLKPLEIDGVSFSSDEKLTSLHDRITPGRGPSMVTEDVETPVEYDSLKIPMSEQEFARVFTERIKD